LLKDPGSRDWKSPLLLPHTGMSFGEDCNVIIEMKYDSIYQKQRVPWWIFLRTDRYKYIRNLLPGETEELYDMRKDPEELNNLAVQSKHLVLLRKLREQTIYELQQTDCAFAQTMPAVKNPLSIDSNPVLLLPIAKVLPLTSKKNLYHFLIIRFRTESKLLWLILLALALPIPQII